MAIFACMLAVVVLVTVVVNLDGKEIAGNAIAGNAGAAAATLLE